MQQRHRDALHAGVLEPGDQPFDLRFRQRLQHLTFVIETLVEREAEFARHQCPGLRRDIQAVEVTPAIPGDLQHVLEATRCDQRDLREALLDNRIGNPGGAVDEAFHITLAQADGLDRLQHRLHRRMRARRHFGDPRFRGIAPDGDDVGEGATDIGSDFPDIRHARWSRFRSRPAMEHQPHRRIVLVTCGRGRGSRPGDGTSRYSHRAAESSRRPGWPATAAPAAPP
jgi:hypothetical protein